MGFKAIATPLADRGVPTIPLRPRTKIAFLDEWESKATISPDQIEAWDTDYPGANAACVAVAKPDGFWFFEVDQPEVIQRIQTETGQKMPRTFRVRSSPGRGHFYFKHSAASLAAGNIAQGYVKNTDWSMRADRQYVVAPGSLHPKTGLPYEIVSTAPIIEAPDWLVAWCVSQKMEPKATVASADGDKIPRGAHDSTLTRIAGKLRHDGMEVDTMTAALIEICEKRCVDYGSDYEEMCEKIAHSICRYPVPKDDTVLIGGRVAGTAPPVADVQVTRPSSYQASAEEIEQRTIVAPIKYPKFPLWAIQQTSIYEGLCKPICDVNMRYPEFMWMPAMTIMLNYIGTRVRVEYKSLMPSIFLALIGKKGRIIKSSSVEDAINYFHYVGIAEHHSTSMRSSEGKVLVMEVGSPEGFGIEMNRLNCKNGILFYDELSSLTGKASIESSTLTSKLLTLYESGKVANVISAKKNNFTLDPGTYCASLIVCSTDENFLANWGRLSGESSGLDDRFFFLFQPEIFKPKSPFTLVPTQPGATETRKLIDKAIAKGTYKITDSSPLQKAMENLENRQEIRAEKFALGLAIDLDRDEIDEECIERALALVKYERDVKAYLPTYEGYTKEGGLQMQIKSILHRAPNAELTRRDLEKLGHAERYGTSLWGQAYRGLLAYGAIAEVGNGVKGDPLRVVLIETKEEEE